ncbi:MAG: hypothetical protein V7751_21830 [Pseudoalteromonas distincta]
MTADEQRRTVEKLYERVIETANKFLTNAKTFNISVLKLHNPTYAQIAAELRQLAQVLDVLAEQIDDGFTGFKAHEYVSYMERIAKAIDQGCTDTLDAVVEELDKRSFLL